MMGSDLACCHLGIPLATIALVIALASVVLAIYGLRRNRIAIEEILRDRNSRTARRVPPRESP